MFYRIMVVGDLHMGGLESYFSEKGIELQCKQLRRLLDAALENKCTDVVFTADIFDMPHPPQIVIAQTLEVLLSKKYQGLCLHFYPGNHDIGRTTVTIGGKDGKAGIRTKVTHSLVLMRDMVEKELVNISKCAELNFYIKPIKADGLPFYFLPYPHMKCDVNNVIVFAHNSVHGAKRDNGTLDDTSEQWNVDLAIKRNQLWVSGHLHTSQDQRRLHFVGVPADNRYLPYRDFFIGIIEYDDKKDKLTDNCYQKIKWKPEWRLIRHEVSVEEDEDVAINYLRTPNTKVKLVLLNGYTRKQLCDDLANSPNVVIDTGTATKSKKKLVAKEGSKQFDADISNKEWIVENLPPTIKRSRQYRRIDKLIDEAESLK